MFLNGAKSRTQTKLLFLIRNRSCNILWGVVHSHYLSHKFIQSLATS